MQLPRRQQADKRGKSGIQRAGIHHAVQVALAVYIVIPRHRAILAHAEADKQQRKRRLIIRQLAKPRRTQLAREIGQQQERHGLGQHFADEVDEAVF